MKKVILSLILLVFVAVGFYLFYEKPAEQDPSGKEVIKIGVGLPLTGDNQESGKIAQNALILFQEDLKGRDLKNEYKFIIEDMDVMQPKRIVLATNKMISADKIDAIISYWNSPGVIVAEVLKGKDIPHINFGSDNKVNQSKFDFRFYSSAKDQVSALFQEASERGIKTIAMLGTNDEWSHGIMDQVEKQASEYGLELVGKQIVNIGERNMNPALNKLRQGNPDLYLLFVETPEFEIARKKMLELGIKKPVTSIELPEYTAETELFEGSWFVSLPEGAKDFNKRVQEFSGNSNTYSAAYMYDIASILVQAFEKAENKSEVADIMQNMTMFKGVVGNTTQKENFFLVPAELKEIKAGEVRLLDN